jgi:hypothetical protein
MIASKHGLQIPIQNPQAKAVTENGGKKKKKTKNKKKTLLAVIWGHGVVKIIRDYMKVELSATYN